MRGHDNFESPFRTSIVRERQNAAAHPEDQPRHILFSHRAFFVSALLLGFRRAVKRRIASAQVSLLNFAAKRRCIFSCWDGLV